MRKKFLVHDTKWWNDKMAHWWRARREKSDSLLRIHHPRTYDWQCKRTLHFFFFFRRNWIFLQICAKSFYDENKKTNFVQLVEKMTIKIFSVILIKWILFCQINTRKKSYNTKIIANNSPKTKSRQNRIFPPIS